jgi:ElaB/YqjD/DUF883 family membrane-anchored ribosome-binding protein
MQKNGTGTLDNKLDTLKESVRNLVDAGHERADSLKSKAIDVKDQVLSNGKAGIEKTSSLVKEHPLAAIGIAFGVGYITMRIFFK